MGTRLMSLTLLFLLMIIFTHGCGEESPFDGEKPEGYFPIAVGNVWTYQTEEGEYDVTMITGTRNIDGRTYHVFETTNPEQSAVFRAAQAHLFGISNPQEAAPIMFRAASDGIYYTAEDAKYVAQELRSEIESILLEGTDLDLGDAQVTVSPPDEWLMLKYPLELGTSWDVVVFEMVVGKPGNSVSSTTKLIAEVVGSETIRVPAGQFDAVKVDYIKKTKIEWDQSVPNTRSSGNFVFSLGVTFWLAPDVGIIKTLGVVPGGIAHVNQLVSYKHLHH